MEAFISQAAGHLYRSRTFIIGPLFVALIAGILMAIFSMLMGGSGTFKQVLRRGHALRRDLDARRASSRRRWLLAGVPPSGVRPPSANLGVFVPMLEETASSAVLLDAIDLILVWWLISAGHRPGRPLQAADRRDRHGSADRVYVVIALIIATFTS